MLPILIVNVDFDSEIFLGVGVNSESSASH